MSITYHPAMVQGSDEWHAARCGMLTASEMDRIITPTLKIANNDRTRSHVWEIAAQRISRHVEPSYISDDMLRGWDDETMARNLYSERIAPVTECGFVTNDDLGFLIGASPDGLVGDAGLIEIKSRRQRFQVETWATGEVPPEYMLQIQTQLFVTGRDWCDFISISPGLPLFVKRIMPSGVWISAICEAADVFETKVREVCLAYHANQEAASPLIATERRPDGEIVL